MSQILSRVQAAVWATPAATDGAGQEDRDAEFSDTLDHGDRIVLTYAPLDERQALQHVRDAGAGATVLFVGTTRNEFEGKSVRSLDYSAYSALANKMMRAVLRRQRDKFGAETGPLKRLYLAHRLGPVGLEEPSILVCASSAHRKMAFEVCEDMLEEVKRTVPVWKKEIYDGQHSGTYEWKANSRAHWTKEQDKDAVQQSGE